MDYKQLTDQYSEGQMLATPFLSIVATFLFVALVNRGSKKKNAKTQILTQADANLALFNTIQNVSGSAENVIFWSNNQKLLLDGEENKRIKFHSSYGTGMSLGLDSQAVQRNRFRDYVARPV